MKINKRVHFPTYVSFILLFSALCLAALAIAYWYGQPHGSGEKGANMSAKAATAHETYVCPMHSHIVQDHPGECPICGMDLVSTKSGHGETNQIQVDTATQQRLGVRLAKVEKTSLGQAIHTYATLVPDESGVHRIMPTMEGVLVKLNAVQPGQRLPAGAILYEFYSETLLQHQNEYLEYLRRITQFKKNEERAREQNRKERENAVASNNEATLKQVDNDIRQREEQLATMLVPIQRDGIRLKSILKYAGFTDDMLRTLERTNLPLATVPVRSQRECIVKEVNARSGMTVGAMTEIMSCVDTAKAWLEIVLYPDQIHAVNAGDSFSARFDDGSEVGGRLGGLSPVLDSETRTLRARIPVRPNSNIPLGSHAEVKIQSAPREFLSAPAGAVLRTGQGNYVLRALDNGHFEPVKVKTGIENEDRIAILDGLAAGDRVVVNGQFLLDAAASIADAGRRLNHATHP